MKGQEENGLQEIRFKKSYCYDQVLEGASKKDRYDFVNMVKKTALKNTEKLFFCFVVSNATTRTYEKTGLFDALSVKNLHRCSWIVSNHVSTRKLYQNN